MTLNNIYTVSKSLIIDILSRYSIIELLYPTKKDEIIKEYKTISEYNTLIIITTDHQSHFKLLLSGKYKLPKENIIVTYICVSIRKKHEA